MATTVIVAVLVGCLALVIAWVVRSDRQNKRRIKELATMLGAVSSGTGGGGVCDGLAYRFTYSAGSNHNPSALKVSIDSPVGQPFQIVREGRAERLSKRIGLSAEIQTGAPTFDDELYIETDAVESTRTLLMHDDAREAVRAIFGLGFTAVRHEGRRLQAVWSPFKLRDDIDPSLITGAVAPLATLARQMPAVPGPSRQLAIPVAMGVIPAGIVMLMALPILAAVGMRFRPLDGGAVFRDSLHHSIPALVVWLALAVVFLRGRSTAHKQLTFVTIASAVVFVLGGNSLETIINGWADAGPPSSHEEQVIRTYSSSGRSTTYHVLVTSWRGPRQTENLVVSSGEYHTAQSHPHITVVTKPGRLGFEWIVSYALAGATR